MKTRWYRFLPVLVLLVPTAGLALSSAAVEPASPVQDDKADKYETFKKDFTQAQKINAKPEMARLVKDNQLETIWWVIDTCVLIATGEIDDVLEERIVDLRAAWKDAFDSAFVDHMYEYYSLLSGPKRKLWFELEASFNKLVDEQFARAESSNDYEVVSVAFENLGVRFEDIGDKYYASRCYQTYAVCQDAELRGHDADLYRAYGGFEKALALRGVIDLKDRDYYDVKSRLEVLEGEGYSGQPPGPGEDPENPGGPPPPGGRAPTAIEAAMTFAPVEELDEFERVNYALDEMYSMWSYLFFQSPPDSAATFPAETLKNGPRFVREGANKLLIDLDGDNEGDVEVPLTGNFERVDIQLGQGEELRSWSFFTRIGIGKDRYQQVEINLEPQQDYMNVYFAPAASVTGMLADVPVRVFDDNMDGIYGSGPLMWNYMGGTEGHAQPEMDGLIVGDGERVQPWSQYVKVGEGWYELEALAGGMQIKARPIDLSTGTLQLDYKGGSPAWLVVRGEQQLENCYFDIAGSKKGVELPVGSYKLFYGELRKGKGLDEMKALILPGDRTPVWTVTEGKTTKATLGKPYGFDFDFKKDGDVAVVEGTSVVITGSADERYERAWNCRPKPLAAWRKVGTKRASKPEKMVLIDNQFAAGDLGWQYLWFPLDVELDVRGVGDEDIEVQLTAKKNKLFGKIESAWKD